MSATTESTVTKVPPLLTPWTAEASEQTNTLPEYPRPQLARLEWQSLNGLWQFAAFSHAALPTTGQSYGELVRVPFPLESALSGIMRHETHSFYRNTFTIPTAWSGRRVQLNFGAVTWRATVLINGHIVGTHTGGYDAFSFDITDQLNGGTNEIVVAVYSPVDAEGIPLGKQRLNGTGIFYTAASGIWQTVWLEPTEAAHITRLNATPDITAGVLNLVVHTTGASGQTVTAVVSTGGKTVASSSAIVGTELRIPIPNAHLWSPDDPFLYDLNVSLSSGDFVAGYFGMRSVATATVNGWLRPVLNGRFIFEMGSLDQGYWPDGIYTAPTDAALRSDLERQKALGFNTVRKHVKVEPARWYYHADRLGLLVLQDIPSMPAGRDPTPSDRLNFEDELRRIIEQYRGITSIVQWNVFNDGWGEYDEARLTDLVKSLDPTRPVNPNAGSNRSGRDPGNGDIIDDHNTIGPGTTALPSTTRFVQLGQFGGIGLRMPGHEWQPGAGFSPELVADAATLNARYVEATATLQGLIWQRGLSASIWTQPTDVENEVNGYYTYGRETFKGNMDQFKAVNAAVQNSVAWLRSGDFISLGVTTFNFTDRYLRHKDSLAITSAISDALSRLDTTFRVRPGLASSSGYSFESRNYPGYYLRHTNNDRVRIDKYDGSEVFKADATFLLRAGHTKHGVSFESFNNTGKFLRHYNSDVYIASNGGGNAWDTTSVWAEDTTWQVASPTWRSGADLTKDSRVSFRVTTSGFTDRYLRHQNSLAITSVANASSDALTRADATFIVRPGLADPSCYSFEASNYPGHYLRHYDFRMRIARSDNSDLFARDATFTAHPGVNDSSAVTLWSYNIAGHAVRHYNSEVWISISSGPKKSDAAAYYEADVTWRVTDALS